MPSAPSGKPEDGPPSLIMTTQNVSGTMMIRMGDDQEIFATIRTRRDYMEPRLITIIKRNVEYKEK